MDDGIVLEMTSPTHLRPSPRIEGLDLHEVAAPDHAERLAHLYREIWRPLGGGGLGDWDGDRWARHLAEPGNEGHIATLDGEDVGMAVLGWSGRGDAAIFVMGVVPTAQGRGIGGDLVTRVVQRLWRPAPCGEHTTRVWLWTRPHEHPATVPHYLARGFVRAPS